MGAAKDQLTQKQQRFIDAYLGEEAYLNGTKAAEIAGYSAPHVAASKMLRNGKVSKALDKERSKRNKANAATRQYKLERLRAIMEGEDDKLAMQAIDLDNKMNNEYIQRIQMNFDGMDNEKLNEESAQIMQQDGWVCFPPNHPRVKEARELLE